MMLSDVKDETGQIVTDHRLYDGGQTTEQLERAGWVRGLLCGPHHA
jgi:hypothetical protein